MVATASPAVPDGAMLSPKLIIPLIAVGGITAAAVVRMQPPEVRVARAEAGRVVNVVYATGVVRPDTETQVAAEVAGRIQALYADEGDLVQAGQPLAKLDATDARTTLHEAERRLETARARLRQVAAPTDPFTVSQIEAQLRAAQARFDAAEERVASARDRIVTARSSARALEAAIGGAQAKQRALRESSRAAQNEIETARERVDTAQAELAQARANLDAARDLHARMQQLFRDKAVAERQVTEARTAAAAAEAAVKAGEARVQTAQRSVQTARANADAAVAQADDAGAAVESARANAAAAQSQVQEAERAVGELQRQVDAQKGEVEAVRSQLAQARRGARPVEVAVPRTEVSTLEAEVVRARQQLDKYLLRSPVTGRVTDRPVDPGDYVAAGSAPTGSSRLFTVASEQRIYVQADVDEADIGEVRLGTECRFQVDAQPGKSYSGTVARIGRQADPSTKTYPVELRNLSDTAGLRIGMTADINIQGQVTESAVLVPTNVLQSETQGTVAWVVDAESRVHKRKVRVKAKDARSIQITEGLAPGDRVVLDPTDKLQDGGRVKVVAGTGDRTAVPLLDTPVGSAGRPRTTDDGPRTRFPLPTMNDRSRRWNPVAGRQTTNGTGSAISLRKLGAGRRIESVVCRPWSVVTFENPWLEPAAKSVVRRLWSVVCSTNVAAHVHRRRSR